MGLEGAWRRVPTGAASKNVTSRDLGRRVVGAASVSEAPREWQGTRCAMVNFKMPRGPNSLVGNAPKPQERDGEYVSKKALRSAAGSVSLRVVANAEADGLARLHPACPLLADADDRGVVLLVLEAGSDCVLRACAALDETACPAGCLALSEEQRINVHVAEDQTASFKAFEPPFETPTELFDVELEVRLLRRRRFPKARLMQCDEDEDEDDEESSDEESSSEDDEDSDSESEDHSSCVVDGVALRASLRHRLRNCWVANGELLCVEAVDVNDHTITHVLRARVASVNSIDPASAAALQPGYHCFRGAFKGEDTKIFVVAEEGITGSFYGTYHHTTRSGDASIKRTPKNDRLTILNQNPRDDLERRSESLIQTETINVITNDGETFPVHRSLLRPCVKLTRHVRSAAPGGVYSSGKRAEWEKENPGIREEGVHLKETVSTTEEEKPSDTEKPHSVVVPIDCEKFDKVLLWLERESLGTTLPEYDVSTAEALVEAADALGLASLADACRASLGAHERRIQTHTWSDVLEHNASGGVRVVVDGMVLDVKRWLPEHPGGDAIIPAQSVNVDATRHFELYHSSKESFLYLRAFYVGEVRAEDVPKIPRVVNQATGAVDPPASQAFLEQLREYTSGFRIDNKQPTKLESEEVSEEDRSPVRAHLGVRS